jgi:hypothetical protein
VRLVAMVDPRIPRSPRDPRLARPAPTHPAVNGGCAPACPSGIGRKCRLRRHLRTAKSPLLESKTPPCVKPSPQKGLRQRRVKAARPRIAGCERPTCARGPTRSVNRPIASTYCRCEARILSADRIASCENQSKVLWITFSVRATIRLSPPANPKRRIPGNCDGFRPPAGCSPETKPTRSAGAVPLPWRTVGTKAACSAFGKIARGCWNAS